jgi:hypothetical protein
MKNETTGEVELTPTSMLIEPTVDVQGFREGLNYRSDRTVYRLIKAQKVEAWQTATGRWVIPVSELIRHRGGA